MNEVTVLNALNDCYDPRLQQNIVALKLVRGVSLEHDVDAPGAGIPGVPEKYIARITLNAPGADEAQNAQLTAQIENRLSAFEQISRTEVTLLPPVFRIL